MLKHLLVILAVFAFNNKIFSQCPEGDIVLNMQEQIDEFLENYPDCTTIYGNLTISDSSDLNDSIEDLFGLVNITRVEGNLEIYKNKALINLKGLEGVKVINGRLSISDNDALVNLEGLENLTLIEGTPNIIERSLTEIDALLNLKSVGEQNNGLTSLKGFEKLTSVSGDLLIYSNRNLLELEGLQNLSRVEGFLEIRENRELINLEALRGLTFIGDRLDIEKNGIRSLQGLDNVIYIGGNLRIVYTSICSLEGLHNVEDIGGNNVNIRDTELTLCGIESLCNFLNKPGVTYNFSNNSIFCNSAGKILKSCESMPNFTDPVDCCPDGDVEMPNQDRIDSFIEIFPNCTKIKGDLIIGNKGTFTDNTYVVNLSDLKNIKSIEGSLLIMNNSDLPNLNGLHNIEEVGENIWIIYNDSLRNVNELNKINLIEGDLRINYNANLDDLSGLQNVTEIKKGLTVTQCHAITSFQDFENLQIYGGSLNLIDNDALVDLKGLNNITSLNDLVIKFNSALTNLESLQNLTEVKGNLEINLNASLESLNGLDNLTSIGGELSIIKNTVLSNIQEINQLDSLGGSLEITENPQLSECSMTPVCNFIYNNPVDYVNITNNKLGCNSITEVLEDCYGFAKVQSHIYYDKNQNKTQEEDEPNVALGSISIQPIDRTIFANPQTGLAQYFLLPGTYTFSINQNTLPNWNLTSDSTQYALTLTEDTCTVIKFGIYPDEQISELQTIINSPNNRCSDTIQFNISTHNSGTTITDGLLWFKVDSLIEGFEYVDVPDTTTIEPNQFGWLFEDLAPGNQISKSINLIIPGPPNFEIGDSLHYSSFSEYNDVNGAHITSIFEYNAEIRCSYDPNDKLVNPNRLCNYTLFEDTLIYTIRFQNTGNDFARDVLIRDTLDANLDLSIFTLLSSSHPEMLSTSLKEENHLTTFEFKGINLPDSTSNLEDSYGYVSYMILPKDGLPEYTVIKNSSGIYFDSNPPIITNTVNNLLVKELPNTTWCKDADMDGLGNAVEMIESCEQPTGYVSVCSDQDDVVGINDYELSSKISIYPNPSSGSFQIVFNEVSFKNAKFNVYNSAGVEVVSQNIINKKNQLYYFQHLSNGVYYINIHLNNEVFLQKKLLILK